MTELHSQEMREIYCKNLIKAAKRDKRVVVLEADLMMSTGTKPFADAYPNRLIDCGIAEANMVGVAAGMASCGKLPFVHSFTPFVTRRCFDQIAISVAYAKQNIRIVGTDPGIMATANGGTHMSFEDIALMKTVPNMVIFEPIDAVMLEKSFPAILECEQPMYIRLFRKKAAPIFDAKLKFDLFKANEVLFGKDITLVASGIMVSRALEAAKQLKEAGIYATVIAVHTYKPLDTETILAAAKRTGAVLTCENSFIQGGLGQSVAEAIAKDASGILFDILGVEDRYGEVGTENYLAETLGLSPNHIAAKAKMLMARKIAR